MARTLTDPLGSLVFPAHFGSQFKPLQIFFALLVCHTPWHSVTIHSLHIVCQYDSLSFSTRGGDTTGVLFATGGT